MPKWKNLNLKSPGIKPKNLPGKNHPNPLPRIRPSNRSQADNRCGDFPGSILATIYNAGAVKIYNTTNRLVRFGTRNILIYLLSKNILAYYICTMLVL
jgi:hypothetical protein